MGSDDYSEYFIEYSLEENTVYISGLDKDDFWIDIAVETEVAEPESYAWGVHDTLERAGIFSTVDRVII